MRYVIKFLIGSSIGWEGQGREITSAKIHYYRKLVDTFHVASECNTAVYFSWCLIQAFAQPVQLFWPLVTFSVASRDSLTDSDLQLFIETEQDRTRHMFIQYYLVTFEVLP